MAKKKNNLFRDLKNLWTAFSDPEIKKLEKFSKDYMKFLDSCKTERETHDFILEQAKKQGFVPIEKAKSGDKKLIISNRGKAIALANMGKRDLNNGFRLVGAHIDAPRLDLKQKPFIEDSNMSLLKTHYYGGIKKYQWVSRPLSLHGVIVKENGKKITFKIGEKENDPVFVIPDLLPHLARKIQYSKTPAELITGEQLNLICGGKAVEDKDEKKKLIAFILELLNKEFGIKEEDFISADIEVVPADKVREVGFDRSFIGGYGHDDRICGYTAFRAINDLKAQPEFTNIALFVDKEEIGSDGPTGAQSNWLMDVVLKLMKHSKIKGTISSLNSIFNSSKALSADVSAAINPMFKEVHDINNAAVSGFGIVISKFTGSGGKYSSNEATAEFTAFIRNLFNKNGVRWQFAELGKIDEGGGGTIAKYISKWGIDTIDCGPALLGMHSPYEIVSKIDLFESYKAYLAFYK